jgi:hypothetical protein
MRNRYLHPALSLAALVTAGLAAQPLLADSLISNTDQPVYGAIPNIFSGQWVAAPFRTGADPARLDSISLYEWTLPTYGPPQGSFSVSIYGNDSGLPGSLLPGGGLSGPSTPQGAAFRTYTASRPLSLAPNTEYWVIASSDVGSAFDTYGWGAAANASFTSPVGWSFFGNTWANTSDQGATWSLQHWYESEGGPQLLAINGVIVPEPSTLALAGLGVVAVCLRSQRNRSSAHTSTI